MSLENQLDDIPTFGELQKSCDWVECESKSRPGKMYYFNLRTACKAWTRPVSRYTHVPRYTLKKIQSTTSDASSPPLMVTDDQNSWTTNEKARKVLVHSSRLNAHQNSGPRKTSVVDPSSNEDRIRHSEKKQPAKTRLKRSKSSVHNQPKRNVKSDKNKGGSKQVTSQKLEPSKIICEMYGTRTINYNCGFLRDVIIETRGSTAEKENEVTENVPDDYTDIILKYKCPNLSEPSSE